MKNVCHSGLPRAGHHLDVCVADGDREADGADGDGVEDDGGGGEDDGDGGEDDCDTRGGETSGEGGGGGDWEERGRTC